MTKQDTLPPLDLTVAGALFDLMGWLTSHETRWVFSARDEASPAVQALQQWAEASGFSISDADVTGWRAALAAQAPQQAQGVAASLQLAAAPQAASAHKLKLCEELRQYAADDDYERQDGSAGTTNRAVAMRKAADLLAAPAPQAAAAPAAAEPEGGTWEENVECLLSKCPYSVRVREGGGPEDLISSLCVTFQGMQMRLEKDPMFTLRTAPAPQALTPLTTDQLDRLETIAFASTNNPTPMECYWFRKGVVVGHDIGAARAASAGGER